MASYPIEILGLYIAPEHRVFGKNNEDVGGEDLVSKEEVKLVSDTGIEGDRFFKLRPDYNGHVTFFSQEVWDEVVNELDLPDSMGPELIRRNIIVSGVDLKSLYGAAFEINGIQFVGTVHCSPCPAMNRAIDPAATKALRGRGGLRAQVKSNGSLQKESAVLIADVLFDQENAGTQPILPRLP
ncbi:MAG: molybdenum cofactor biosysynthesis protein [Opitutales bacterium]|jgi:MOSC domain-containing protein YiiM|nr:molybdenum cofactor biosysynthesis protein [Opitutales bacterium]